MKIYSPMKKLKHHQPLNNAGDNVNKMIIPDLSMEKLANVNLDGNKKRELLCLLECV